MKKLSILLAIVLIFAAVVINKNFDKIASYQAKQCFKKNDIACAQRNFEKAFSLGLHQDKDRDIYINTLINEPLTIESQKKLVNFLEFPIEDSARIKVEHFLYDLKREIHKNYPDNYIANATYNQKVIRWGKKPITYSFTGTEKIPLYYKQEIENAFNTWENVTDRELLFTEDNISPNITINFLEHNPADIENNKYIVAYTAPDIQGPTLNKMTIKFYLKDIEGNYFSENQVYNTALHEIMHALGFMGHSNNKKTIMYLTKDSQTLNKDSRDIPTSADVNSLRLLYKIKPEITNSFELAGEYIPYLVIGDDTEINTAKKREAQSYIRKAPGISAGYMDLAESYVTAKDYPRALVSLEKALNLADSEDVKQMIYYNIAIVYYHMDHTELAFDNVQRSMQISENEDQHHLLAEIYTREQNFSKAIGEYKYLIDKHPNNLDYTIALTNLYIRQKEFFKARKVLKNFVQQNPTEKNNPRFESYGILKLGL